MTATGAGSCAADGQGGTGGAPDQRCLHRGVGQPELLFSIDGGNHSFHLIPVVGQQLEYTDEHAVVAKLVLFADALLDGHN